jgi:hypothetical protein
MPQARSLKTLKLMQVTVELARQMRFVSLNPF